MHMYITLVHSQVTDRSFPSISMQYTPTDSGTLRTAYPRDLPLLHRGLLAALNPPLHRHLIGAGVTSLGAVDPPPLHQVTTTVMPGASSGGSRKVSVLTTTASGVVETSEGVMTAKEGVLKGTTAA